MASKFMAFEGVASTSTVSMENNGYTEEERIEMNASQYPSYRSNQNNAEPSPYGAVDEEDNLNENLDEKCDQNVGYRKFIFNNSEQFKSVCSGLLLLASSGIHIVWGIYRVFHLYNCKEENHFYLRFIICSWYIGAIMGSCCSGFVLAKIRKGRLYFIGGGLLICSGAFLMFSENETSHCLLISRTIAGFTQGLIYVVVVVHASENSTSEFREFLMLIIGAVLNYSILLSVLAFTHTEGTLTGILNGLGLITFGACAMMITVKHSTETVPFILQNSGSELDALQTVSKLKKRPVAAPSVQQDFILMKNLVQDEIEHYGEPNFRKVLLPENRKSLIFCCYGRLCSVLSFNLPLIVMIMIFLREWLDGSFESDGAEIGNCFNKYTNNQNKIELENESPNRDKRYAMDIETIIEKPKFLKQYEEMERMERIERRFKREQSKDTKESKESKEPKEPKEPKETKEPKEPKEPEESKEPKELKELKEHEKSPESKSTEKKSPESKTSESKSPESKTKEPKKLNHHDHDEKKQKSDQDKKLNEHERESNHKNNHNENADTGEHHKKQGESNENTKPDAVEENMAKSSPVLLAPLLHILHSRELTFVLLAWFIFGSITAAALYTFNLKRTIYYISCVLSSALVITGIAHSMKFFSGIFHLCLIIYFNYVTIPIDVFGHCMLAEAFPVTLKAFSVASVAIIEHLVHIIIITLFLSDWFHDGIILFMCFVAFASHEIARNLPQKGALSLAEAREQYQHIDLMLLNEPKTGYNQQQEFI